MDAILGPSGNRSAFVEQALRAFLIVRAQQIRDANDLEILNRRANMDALLFPLDMQGVALYFMYNLYD